MILLDEPLIGPRPELIEGVFRIIKKLKPESVTILIVEQLAAAALEVCDCGYVLESGGVAVSGTGGRPETEPSGPGPST